MCLGFWRCAANFKDNETERGRVNMTKWMYVFILGLVSIDQSLKHLAKTYYEANWGKTQYSGHVDIIPNFLNVTYAENRGAAFGMLKDQQWFFILFTLSVIAVFIYLIECKKISNKLFLASATLLISGGFGNLIDRIYRGYVVDYLKFSIFPTVCNFADICIVVGTVILGIYILFYYKSSKIRG